MQTILKRFTPVQIIAAIFIALLFASVIVFVFTATDDNTSTVAESKTKTAADDSTKVARAKQDLRLLSEMVIQAQLNAKGPLLNVTKSQCSDCVCRDGIDLRNISDASPCMATWLRIVKRLQALQSTATDATGFKRDPWGSPYALDENQGERGAIGCKTPDRLRSVGRDGKWGTSDDIIVNLPLSSICP